MIQCTTRIDDRSLFLHDKQCDSYHILAIIFHYLGAVGGVKLVLVSYWSAALGNHPPSRATAHQSNRSIGFYDVCKQEKCLTTLISYDPYLNSCALIAKERVKGQNKPVFG